VGLGWHAPMQRQRTSHEPRREFTLITLKHNPDFRQLCVLFASPAAHEA
jgi:hypothetical protein